MGAITVDDDVAFLVTSTLAPIEDFAVSLNAVEDVVENELVDNAHL